MKIAIISATSLIAKHCIRRWSETGNHQFVLVGRNQNKLAATAQDFRIRYPHSTFEVAGFDLESPPKLGEFFKSKSSKDLDIAFIAQGSLTDQLTASSDLNYLKNELSINAVSVALFLEAFAALFEKQGHGQLAVIGSVAGDRGRAYNYSYGASKALIETYVEGLQQRFAGTRVSVSLIKPGPTATPMTLTHKGNMSSPDLVGKIIVEGIEKRSRIIYAPKLWALIMFIVRSIPFVIFKRMKF